MRCWRPPTLAGILIRTVVLVAAFSEEEFTSSFDRLANGSEFVEAIDCDGLLIDTFLKGIGKGLLVLRGWRGMCSIWRAATAHCW